MKYNGKKISTKNLKVWNYFIKNLDEIEDKDEISFLRGKSTTNQIKVLDLHGESLSNANLKVISFIQNCYDGGYKCLKIITGKGLRSKNRKNPYLSEDMNILKNSVPEFVKKHEIKKKIIKMLPAKDHDGGKGAFYIFLKKKIKE